MESASEQKYFNFNQTQSATAFLQILVFDPKRTSSPLTHSLKMYASNISETWAVTEKVSFTWHARTPGNRTVDIPQNHIPDDHEIRNFIGHDFTRSMISMHQKSDADSPRLDSFECLATWKRLTIRITWRRKRSTTTGWCFIICEVYVCYLLTEFFSDTASRGLAGVCKTILAGPSCFHWKFTFWRGQGERNDEKTKKGPERAVAVQEVLDLWDS